MTGEGSSQGVKAAAAAVLPVRAPGAGLVVDPDPAVRDLLVRILQREGVEAHALATPAEAVVTAASIDRIDLFVIDLPPGAGDYGQFFEALRLRHPLASTVVLSAVPSQEQTLAAMRAGAEDLMGKPFADLARVGQALRQALGRSRARHELALALPEVARLRDEGAQLRRDMEKLQAACAEQVQSFEDSQEVFYLDLSRMMTIVDNIVNGIVFTDRDARINLLNPMAERLLGVKAFTAIGQQVGELTGRAELLEVVAEDQSRVLEEDTVNRTVEIHDSRDDLLYIKVTTTAVTDYRGSFAGLLTLLQDVTAEFKADQLKNQYLSIVSHELRTPLTGIKTFITMMAKGAVGEVNERQARILETIREQSLRLEHQIDKLISLGMLDQEDFAQDFQVFTVPEVVQGAAASFDQEAKDRGVSLNVQLPANAADVCLRADRENIKRVLQILLENGIKFNRPRGRVALSVLAGPEEVLFRVSDTGIGIDPKYHKRIFEKFFQVEDPLTRQHGGAGLGLTVAERILRSHRTHMNLESSLGQGSTFQFSLKRYHLSPGPRAQESRGQAEAASRERSGR